MSKPSKPPATNAAPEPPPQPPVAPEQPAVVRFESDYPSLALFVDGEYFVRFVDGVAEALESDPAIVALRACELVREVVA